MNKSSWLLIILTLAICPAVAGSATDCLDAQRVSNQAGQIYHNAAGGFLAREYGITDPAITEDPQRLGQVLGSAIAAKAGVPDDGSEASTKAICALALRLFAASQREMEDAMAALQDVERLCGSETVTTATVIQFTFAYGQRLAITNGCHALGVQ